MVVNRLTAPWYLDRLYWNACYYRGFIRFAKGDYDEALVEFASALALNPQLQQQHDTMLASFQRRLEMACRGRRMFLTPAEIAAFRGADLLRFRLGEFYALWERWDEAERIYRGVLDRVESSRNQKACALRALAEAARYKAPPDETTALDLYTRLLKDYRRTPSEQPALLEVAALDQTSLERRIAWLDEAYALDPRTDTGQKALYMKGFLLRCGGRKQAATETLSEFIRRYPDSRFVAVSRDLLAEMK
jgi:tetratricopeptide (TPR) repeat protein